MSNSIEESATASSSAGGLVRPALVLLALFTALTGVLYPLAVTGAAQALFPDEANGSLIRRHGQVVGSQLIGQRFDDPKYFWGRPSATGPAPYNAAASTGSNLGPLHPALAEAITARIAALRAADPAQAAPVPVDLVTASGSGLDPHVSPAAALYQVGRVARLRGLDEERLRQLVAAHTAARTVGIFGEPRVNVLRLNLALDQLVPQ
jgi:potassium-transporting ATPase KdpC subunit